jgi:hypothetical protein
MTTLIEGGHAAAASDDGAGREEALAAITEELYKLTPAEKMGNIAVGAPEQQPEQSKTPIDDWTHNLTEAEIDSIFSEGWGRGPGGSLMGYGES